MRKLQKSMRLPSKPAKWRIKDEIMVKFSEEDLLHWPVALPLDQIMTREKPIKDIITVEIAGGTATSGS